MMKTTEKLRKRVELCTVSLQLYVSDSVLYLGYVLTLMEYTPCMGGSIKLIVEARTPFAINYRWSGKSKSHVQRITSH